MEMCIKCKASLARPCRNPEAIELGRVNSKEWRWKRMFSCYSLRDGFSWGSHQAGP